ncbi:MAG: hypothetical protein ACWGNV_15495 [Bacteroidales bacterium]
MKRVSTLVAVVAACMFSISSMAQDPTVVLEFMKVTQESEATYLQVEQAWKQIHQKRVQEGLAAGWQLWRKVHAGYKDPYQYITINWYNDFAQSFKPVPDGFFEQFFNGPDSSIFNQTGSSRILAHVEVSHQIGSAENNQGAGLIVINRMKVKPENQSDYVQMEMEVFKPMHEEGIRRGERAHWSIWSNWPYDKGQATYTTVDGYADAAQLTAEGTDLFSAVHPDLNMEQVSEKIMKLRYLESSEIWELVDSVFPEE